MYSPTTIAQWLLRLSGAATCTACFAVFLPNDWMDSIHARVGLGELPKAPIVEYMARTLAAMYFAHGVMVLAASTKVDKFWGFVGLIGFINALLGTTFLVVDMKSKMPWYWTLFEGPPIAVLGFILILVWHRGNNGPPK